MPRALKTCSQPNCPNLVTRGRCPDCKRQADRQRGTRHQRGYGKGHTTRFRPAVLRKDPLCVCTNTSHGHGQPCLAPSTVADHWPLDKRELAARGLDSNNPRHGRGLCKPCHDRHTAAAQPGGWHAGMSR